MQHRMAGALAGLCILVAGCSANSNRATPTTTPSTTVPPVAQGALDGLLLSASQINAAMGATELSVADDTKRMEDVSANGVARSAFPFTVQRRPMPTPTVDGPGFTDNFWASHRTLMWPSRVSCCFPQRNRPAHSSPPRRNAGRPAPTGALPTPCPAVVRCGLSGRSPTTTAF
jgi:hypothetical protein